MFTPGVITELSDQCCYTGRAEDDVSDSKVSCKNLMYDYVQVDISYRILFVLGGVVSLTVTVNVP